MKKKIIFLFLAFLLVASTGIASAAQWSLNDTDENWYYDFGSGWAGYYTVDGTVTGTPLYNINWATTVVDGTGIIPSTGSGSYDYNSWQDGTDFRDQGTFALGIPDMVYGDPAGTYEMFGGATGFSGKEAEDNWMVLGFDAPLVNKVTGEGVDMRVHQLGWHPVGMEILVSTDSTYTDVESMTWISLGMLDDTTKPMTWTAGTTVPYMDFEFDDYGITGDVNYVMFEGKGHWIDAVGSPVPIPGSVLLLGSGLLSLIGIRRKRQ
ncbi:MAG: hypothetical protein PVG39_09550 [Desulfobacteraceae bacterium]|jgi:hypothetical protein